MSRETTSAAIQVSEDGQTVIILGVSYAADFFLAMSQRLKPGTRVEVFQRSDGTWELYTYRLPAPR